MPAAAIDAPDLARERDDENAAFTREVGRQATRAIQPFGEDRYGAGYRAAHRFGGSHAQRATSSTLTLVEAARRAGHKSLAQALEIV